MPDHLEVIKCQQAEEEKKKSHLLSLMVHLLHLIVDVVVVPSSFKNKKRF